MKLTETTILAAFFASMIGTASFAGIFDLPAHQQNGFRDTGCDEAARVEIRNDAGDLLYVNNPTCSSVGGAGAELGAQIKQLIADLRDVRAEEPEDSPAVK